MSTTRYPPARQALVALALSGALVGAAHAGPERPEPPSLSLQASVSKTTVQDEMVVLLVVEREGPAIAALNRQVSSEAAALLAQVKGQAGVHAQLAGLSTSQVHGPQGQLLRWRVRSELLLESKDLDKLAELAGKLGARAQLANVHLRLSNERRQAIESELLARAGEQFGAKALAAAKSLGYRGYEIREMTLNDEGAMPGPHPMVAARAEMMASSDGSVPVPVAPGRVTVSIAYTGKIALTR